MPKKKGKGRKKGGQEKVKRVLTYCGPMEVYAKIIKLLGDRRVTIVLEDGQEVLGIIPGRFRKRVWMKPGDIVLASLREFQDNKNDIIHKYTTDEIRKLVKEKEIPRFFLDGLATTSDETGEITFEVEEKDDAFDFGDI